MSYSFTNTTKSKIPSLPFEKMKDKVLGKKYEASFAIASASEIKKLNLAYRGKNKATDILSFPLSKTAGEIIICPSEARKEAVKFERSYDNFIGFLFIHGLLHLKGYTHGSTMESNEKKVRKLFGI